ncbi:MAG: serine hydrolase family protein [Devosiaceae bacterium]|nr:serine hydrolase family protein [Devosiaceae bacterium MH13]
MAIADIDFLVCPGWKGGDPGIWYERWVEKLPHAQRVEQADFETPTLSHWVEQIETHIAACERPVVLIGHSLGALTIAHMADRLADQPVIAAFLVTPPELAGKSTIGHLLTGFEPLPTAPLPVPSFLVGSRTDPYASYSFTEGCAHAWGSELVDAGDAGHINVDSGHGPWPEGLLRLGVLLKRARG